MAWKVVCHCPGGPDSMASVRLGEDPTQCRLKNNQQEKCFGSGPLKRSNQTKQNKTKQNKTKQNKQTNKQQIEEEENSCSTNFQSFHRSQVLSPIPFPKQITYIDSPLSLPDYHPHLTLKLQTSPEKIYQLSLGKISQVVWIFRLVLKS